MQTIEDAVREVANHEAGLQIHQVQSHDLRADGFALWSDSLRWDLQQQGLQHFCGRARAPADYLAKLTPGLAGRLLQHHIDQGDIGVGTLTLVSRGGVFLAVKRSDLAELTGTEVLQSVLEGIGHQTAPLSAAGPSFTPDSFAVDILSDETSREVSPGDVIRGGLRIEHSFIGEWATVIQTYFLRLVCANGMVHRECAGSKAVRTRRLRSDWADAKQQQMTQVRRLAQREWEKLGTKLAALQALQDTRIEVEAFLERWVRQARLSPRNLLPVLRQAWREEGAPQTAFGAINALTRVATHSTRVCPRQRRILSRLAGLLAFRQLHWCPRCMSLLRS